MTIREWINNPSDFEAGLKLYEQYGTHGNLKRILRRSGDTARNRKTLVYELSKIIGKDEATAKSKPIHIQPEIKPQVPKQNIIHQAGQEPMIIYNSQEEKKPVQDLEKLHKKIEQAREVLNNPDIAALEKQWRDVFRRAHYIKTQLPHYQTQDQRAVACGQILSMMDECEKIWKKIDHYKLNGSLPEETNIQAEDLNDPLSLFKRKKNLLTYISKGKKGTVNYTPERIAEMEKEVEEIEEKLKTMNV